MKHNRIYVDISYFMFIQIQEIRLPWQPSLLCLYRLLQSATTLAPATLCNLHSLEGAGLVHVATTLLTSAAHSIHRQGAVALRPDLAFLVKAQLIFTDLSRSFRLSNLTAPGWVKSPPRDSSHSHSPSLLYSWQCHLFKWNNIHEGDFEKQETHSEWSPGFQRNCNVSEQVITLRRKT